MSSDVDRRPRGRGPSWTVNAQASARTHPITDQPRNVFTMMIGAVALPVDRWAVAVPTAIAATRATMNSGRVIPDMDDLRLRNEPAPPGGRRRGGLGSISPPPVLAPARESVVTVRHHSDRHCCCHQF